MTDFLAELDALAEGEWQLATRFERDRDCLDEWIAAMAAVNGHIRENLPAILAMGRERDAYRERLLEYLNDPTVRRVGGSLNIRARRALAADYSALEGGNQ